MLCKNCGHDITPSEKHCPFCGMESGFPVGMTGDEKIPAVIDAEEILGDVISEAAAPVAAPTPAPEKPVQNEAEIFDQLNDAAEDNGTVAYVPSDATTKSVDSPTVVFGAVSEQAAASTDRYDEDYAEEFDDDYSYNNVVAPTDEPDYDDYDEGYAPTRGGLTLTNTQIGLISGVAAFIILLIIVILLFTQCGGGNDNDVSSDNFGALSSNVATSSNASSLPSSSSELSSDQSSSSGLSEPEEISSQAPSQTTTSNTVTSEPTTSTATSTPTTSTPTTSTPTTSTPTTSTATSTPTTSEPEAPTPTTSTDPAT
ncbi:MAG: hypothetical protein II284_01520 [Clostridia bacterium]|nr:hypothetical protein [Clostridia bacterium]